jgi:hypothetical protein
MNGCQTVPLHDVSTLRDARMVLPMVETALYGSEAQELGDFNVVRWLNFAALCLRFEWDEQLKIDMIDMSLYPAAQTFPQAGCNGLNLKIC